MDELLAGITLNDNQRRHFEVLLTRLEDSLSTIKMLLAERLDPALLRLAESLQHLGSALKR